MLTRRGNKDVGTLQKPYLFARLPVRNCWLCAQKVDIRCVVWSPGTLLPPEHLESCVVSIGGPFQRCVHSGEADRRSPRPADGSRSFEYEILPSPRLNPTLPLFSLFFKFLFLVLFLADFRPPPILQRHSSLYAYETPVPASLNCKSI